jgi:hypothetical protein
MLYAAVVTPERRAASQLQQQARRLYDVANENDGFLAEEPRVNALRRAVHAEIGRLAGENEDTPGRALLEILDEGSSELRLRIVGVAPMATAGTKPSSELREQDVAIDAEGGFLPLLALVGRFSEAPEVVAITSLRLSVSDAGRNQTPVLHASVGACIYTLAVGWEKTKL